MRFSTLLFWVRFFTVVAIGTTLSVVLLVDPDVSGSTGVVFLTLSLFVSLLGFFTLVLAGIARRIIGDESASRAIGSFFRQGSLLAALPPGLLFLSHFGALAWWTTLLLVAFLLLVELTVRAASPAAR